MTEQKTLTNTLEKVINWTRSVDITIPISKAEIFQRVENINTMFMENAIIQVQIFLKLFVLDSNTEENKYSFSQSTVFTKEVEINTLINLNTQIDQKDIISIDPQVTIGKYFCRSDRIVVNGTLKIILTYTEHLILSGNVLNFLNKTPIAGATINVRNLDNNDILASTKTDSKGLYSFDYLSPGVYLLEAITESHKPEQKISVIKTRDIVNFILHD
ncbi:MAG: Cna protein B-type domain protein [Pelotomaculum sp. PtaU1.Bin035]|nr:MAG: Cna protein B-type domain protein [Pelotomaculum sp. PtaU1.Bin035]